MKKFAKLLAMVLAVSMVLTMFVGAFDYVDAAAIDEDKAAAVNTVYEAGIMMGNNKGEFNAKANLTRDEMAKIMFALASYEQKADDVYSVYASVSFADYANIPAWSKSYVGFAAAAGIVVGDAKGNANALGTLSYVEAAIMLMRTLDLEGTYTDGEDEVPFFTGSKWYQNAVLVAYTEGLFADLDIADYKAAITREDVAVMIANAMDHANADYATAYAINDTIVGTEEVTIDGEEVEILEFLNGSVAEPILAEGYEDAIFHEVYAVVENGEILTIEVVEPLFEGEVLAGDIEFVEEEDEDENVYYNLVIEGEVIVEDYDAADFELIDLTDGFEAAASYDYVSIIINENTIFGKADPVQFWYFVEDEWAPEEIYDAEEKAWTGEFQVEVDGTAYAIDAAYAELELEGMYSFQIVDDKEIVNIKKVDAVSVYDLDTKYDAKENEYTVSYKGVEINEEFAAIDEQAVWTEQLVATEEISGDEVEDIVVYLYKDYVYVGYEVIFVEEEEEEETETVYGFVTGFDAELKITEDDEETDEDEYKIEWIITVDAVVKGEATQFVYAQEQDEVVFAKPAYVDYAFAAFELDAEGKTVGTPVETAITTYDIVSIADGKLNDVEFEGEFYDYTGSELTFADLSYEIKDGKTTFKAGGKRVSANFIAAYEYADVIVVVFDAAEEDRFGAYGAIAE